jgi:uncharacterized protein YgbK (DUF1537 family)
MEVLAFAGLPTVLFLDPPSPTRLEAFRAYRGIGIAGTARACAPAWMDEHLPPAFHLLVQTGAPVLDRHPTMSRHPTTPMDEADLHRHLGRQTHHRTGLVDFVAMKRGEATQQLQKALADGADIVSIDVLDRETLVEAGRLIWEFGGDRMFGVGSQGFEAALVAWWQHNGLLPVSQAPPIPARRRVLPASPARSLR